jgi:UDP-N-acetylmuramyl pentapeptide phosphotransferase/UDP-N-acetylglucosamine-1-phosphate transferase
LIDIPNHRSSHKQPTPRGGGLGFIIAFIIGLIIYQIASNQSDIVISNGVWLSLIPLVCIGILDDWRNLPASIRYIVQLSVSGLIVLQTGAFPQPWLDYLGPLGAIIAVGLTIVGITAMINFYNFMDGLDGLVAGVSLVQFSFCAIALNQPVLWILVGALLGFLVWNWSPAKIFMGDAGSTVLGAVLAISLLHNPSDPQTAWTYLAITIPLLADAIYTLVRRLIQRENIFQAHRTHLYQRLNQAGWSHSRVASFYIGAAGLVSFSVYFFGATGAWLSLLGSIAAIIQVENYLQQYHHGLLGTAPARSVMNLTAFIERPIESEKPSL